MWLGADLPAWTSHRTEEASAGDLTDETLVEAFRLGDVHAFDQLFARYRQPIFGYVYRSVGGAAIAEELTQDVFLKVFLHLNRVHVDAGFRTWIYRIATTTCIDAHRMASRRPLVALDDARLEDSPCVAKSDDPVERQLGREQQRDVRMALDVLPARYRQVLVLRQFHDLTYAELAEVLGIAVEAVTSLVHRARQAFRDAYTQLQKGGT